MSLEKWIEQIAGSRIRRAGLLAAVSLLAASSVASAALSREQELRARVDQLYGALRRGDWHTAEVCLTKESRPIFRNQPKKPISEYRIESVKLEATGNSAAVVISIPLAGGMLPLPPVFIPNTTTWRRVHGRWYMELPDPHAAQSLSNPAARGEAPSPPLSLRPKDLEFESNWATVGYVHKGEVKVAQFRVTNVSQRLVTLGSVQADCACLRMKSQQKEFKPGETAVLEFELDPSSLSFNVRQALTLTVGVVSEPEHALTQLTVAAVLMPGSAEPPAH
jgi:hypothetical protein